MLLLAGMLDNMWKKISSISTFARFVTILLTRFAQVGESDEPEQCEARVLRQREVSDVVEQFFVRIE